MASVSCQVTFALFSTWRLRYALLGSCGSVEHGVCSNRAVLNIATGDSDVWLDRFDERIGQHSTLRAVDITGLDQATAALLAPSLAIFQLGESGTGAHLFEAARRACTDAGYQQCLERFVREEQEHARMLEVVLDEMGEPVRHRHWTDRAFVLRRRAH